ncbi:MAG: formate dehydrogenase accessory sulfurtransferase FdhD [Promethearchaeota archaeon]
MTQAVSILRHDETGSEKRTDIVTREVGLRIILRDSGAEDNFALVHTLPIDYESLIVGLLFTSRLVASPNEIIQIRIRNRLATVQLSDGTNFEEKLAAIRPTARIVMGLCGPEEGALGTWQACDIPAIDNPLVLSPIAVHTAIQNMSHEMSIYRETGGTHGAALAALGGDLVQVAEDVGRHNAVDRVIGAALRNNQSVSDLILVCSGRLTGDLILKAAVARIPVVASISAAVSSGIELAEAAGITLIGFVRGARMNIYTHPDRLAI